MLKQKNYLLHGTHQKFQIRKWFQSISGGIYQSNFSTNSLTKEYGVIVHNAEWVDKNDGTQTIDDKTSTNAEVNQLQKENKRLKE